MILIASLLVEPAKEVGIEVPPDIENYNPNEFPHWHSFLNAQFGRPMPHPDSHWRNAEIIASFNDAEIKQATWNDLIEKGWE